MIVKMTLMCLCISRRPNYSNDHSETCDNSGGGQHIMAKETILVTLLMIQTMLLMMMLIKWTQWWYRVMMMAIISTSKTLINFYETIWCNNPEDSQLHTCRRENLKSHIGIIHILRHERIQEFVCRFFLQEILKCSWVFLTFQMLHMEITPNLDESLNTKPEYRSAIFWIIQMEDSGNTMWKDRIYQQIESTVGFKRRISFISYNPNNPSKGRLLVHVLANSGNYYIFHLYHTFGK
jgi:hypothetical protein